MNRKMTWAAACAALSISVAYAANEKPTAEYVQAMKTMNQANGQIRQAVTAKDYDAIAAAAGSLKGAADVTAKYWTGKAEDAAKTSADVVKAVADLEKAAKAKDDAGITAAAGVIGGSCRSCHTAHRSERLPDGTYEIK